MEGIDVAPTTAWLAEHVGLEPPLEFNLIAGGRSNLTFEVVDAGGREAVLRRPPTGHVLPTAHDMRREHRVVSALGPTAVPVPAALGLCEDDGVNGAPFYVMERVHGHVLRDTATAEKELDELARRRSGAALVEVLAALHEVDVDAVGLGDLCRREG
ncbi:MAG: phosphotransferase family protein, partial [Acidimicrobiales bacterium]